MSVSTIAIYLLFMFCRNHPSPWNLLNWTLSPRSQRYFYDLWDLEKISLEFLKEAAPTHWDLWGKFTKILNFELQTKFTNYKGILKRSSTNTQRPMKKIEDWWKCNFDLNSFFLQLNRYFGSLQIIKKCIHSYWKAVLPFQIYIGLAFAGKLNKTFEVQLKAWGCLWNENWGISRELTTDSADRCGPQKLQIASNLFKFA